MFFYWSASLFISFFFFFLVNNTIKLHPSTFVPPCRSVALINAALRPIFSVYRFINWGVEKKILFVTSRCARLASLSCSVCFYSQLPQSPTPTIWLSLSSITRPQIIFVSFLHERLQHDFIHASSAVPKLAYNQAPRCPPATSNRYSIGIFFFFIFLRYAFFDKLIEWRVPAMIAGRLSIVWQKKMRVNSWNATYGRRPARPNGSTIHDHNFSNHFRVTHTSDRASQNRMIGRG